MKPIEDRYKAILETYNKLEVLFKVSQMVQEIFQVPVLNEYRYISRALVDYCETSKDEEKLKAISKLEVAISAAYNDILDSIVMAIKFTVSELKDKYPNVYSMEILKKYQYKEKIAPAIAEAEKNIVHTRFDRTNRFDTYYNFSNSEDYNALVEFARFLHIVEYEFILSAEASVEELQRVMINNIHKCLLDSLEYPKFELVYQPKYSDKKEIVGAEALIRMRLSKSVLLPPTAFLDIVNDSMLFEELDIFVLKMVKNDIISIKKDLPENFKISINVSPSTISKHKYIELFNDIIRENRIEEILSIEIIETWNHDEDEYMKAHYKLGELNSKTKVAIDDFGAGRTKLDYIAMISNIDTIKIDKVYTDKLETNNKEKALKLISGINKLAEETKLKVIVEGVETENQFNSLKEIGIKSFQGYYFNKPLEFEKFKDLIANHHA